MSELKTSNYDRESDFVALCQLGANQMVQKRIEKQLKTIDLKVFTARLS